MSIITISRGAYSHGEEIAVQVAERLGYRCISRDDIQRETAARFKVPEVKLDRNIHDAPTILDRLGYRKEKFLAYLQAVTLENFKEGDVVYHGLAGHFLVRHVAHVLKVRIIADMEARVQLEVEREGISSDDARKSLEKDDAERTRWSTYLFGVDTHDPQMYDLVLHINKLSVDDAVDLICQAVARPQFQTTEESRQDIVDMALAAEVRVALVDAHPEVEVTCQGGEVVIRTSVAMVKEADVVEGIKQVAKTVEGVDEVQVLPHSSLMDV